MEAAGRSPHGERGLKSWLEDPGRIYYQSLPSRGAWIEIATYGLLKPIHTVAPLTGSVD